MGRFFAVLLLLIILRLAFKSFTGQLKIAVFGPPGRPDPRTSRPPQVAAETLVQCARCGTYVAASRALKGQGMGMGEREREREVFCSEECRRGERPS
ncbi:MAG TPA: hypothetical protein VKK31_07245 [Thermoanaerobaculia bacterium]|nr:hypothetical protein [Thermoanaerobaculia bacterium]